MKIVKTLITAAEIVEKTSIYKRQTQVRGIEHFNKKFLRFRWNIKILASLSTFNIIQGRVSKDAEERKRREVS